MRGMFFFWNKIKKKCEKTKLNLKIHKIKLY